VPLLFFVLGFAAARLLGASEGLSILVSFLCLIPAALLLIRSQKRKTAENPIRFDIIS
jgi:positive regulator of sigma E activity